MHPHPVCSNAECLTNPFFPRCILMERKRPLFRCTPAQAFLAIVPACIVLVALISFSVGTLNGHGFDPGFTWGYDQPLSNGYITVRDVSPAARAVGLRTNDRILWGSLDLKTRLILITERWAHFGTPIALVVQRGNARHKVTIVPRPDLSLTVQDILTGALQLTAVLVTLFVGTLLVMLRPSKATWAWFIVSLWLASTWLSDQNYTPFSSFSSLPVATYLVVALLALLLETAAYLSLSVFAIYFPNRQPGTLGRIYNRAIPYVFIIIGGSNIANYILSLRCRCVPFWLGRMGLMTSEALFITATAFAMLAYFQSRGIDRQKIQWIAPAFALAYIPFSIPDIIIVAQNSFHVNLSNLYRPLPWLELLYVAPPLAVAYTVLRHRVYDIRFVISRAIVLTILTAFVVIAFALIDWIFVHKIEQTGLGVVAGILVVTVLGFTANAMHRRVDRFVDKTLFKRRHLAEERLLHLAHDLPGARSLEALSAMLVKEPLDAFKLASAALFRRGDGDTFVRADAIGWPDGALCELQIDEPPLSPMADLRETARIHWHDPNNIEFPSPDGFPIFALPVNLRSRLQAIALYSPHEDGLDLDPDEISAINGLMVPAAAAYDHLEAQELRRQAEKMRAELEFLRESNAATDL